MGYDRKDIEAKISLQKFGLSPESLLYMKLLANRCGIDLNNYREDTIYNHLVRRLRALSLSDFDSYCYLLRMDVAEEQKFINLITNPTTKFFRENHHFEYLKNNLLPALIAKKKRIRIWSAGCSTGEEPYSIAMVVKEVLPEFGNYDIKILATDINSDSLITAEAGIYHVNKIHELSIARKYLWFEKLSDKNDSLVKVNESLKNFILFEKLNMIGEWPMQGPMDIIFCRNVMIYFKQAVNERLLMKFDKLLADGGTFFIGHSESLHSIRNKYQLIDKTVYKKFLRRSYEHEEKN